MKTQVSTRARVVGSQKHALKFGLVRGVLFLVVSRLEYDFLIATFFLCILGRPGLIGAFDFRFQQVGSGPKLLKRWLSVITC